MLSVRIDGNGVIVSFFQGSFESFPDGITLALVDGIGHDLQEIKFLQNQGRIVRRTIIHHNDIRGVFQDFRQDPFKLFSVVVGWNYYTVFHYRISPVYP